MSSEFVDDINNFVFVYFRLDDDVDFGIIYGFLCFADFVLD